MMATKLLQLQIKSILKRRLCLLSLGCSLLVLAVMLMGCFLQAGSIPVVVMGGTKGERTLVAAGAARRTLMSRNTIVTMATISKNITASSPLAAPAQFPRQLQKTELKALLQQSTSKLYCSSRTRTLYNSISAVTGNHQQSSRTGYILVLSFREQQTKASDNLFDLQCWARSLRVNIVEPFVENSHLVVPIPANSSTTQLFKFGDIFDAEVWRLLSMQHNFPPLTPWEAFYTNAPRELIVVRFKYRTYKMGLQKGTSRTTTPHNELCEISEELRAKVEYLTKTHNFVVVREVCINFVSGGDLTSRQFNQRIYDNFEPESVTVLMEQWRGLSPQEGGRRVSLSNACSGTSMASMPYAWPSQKLICDSRKYKQKFFQGKEYISVMVRTEKMGRVGTSQEFMSSCLNKTLNEWRALKASTGVTNTFLAMDIGHYGSYSLVGKNNDKYHPFVHLYTDFIKELFGEDATIESWESTFESIVPRKDMGYIGSLQKAVAAQGKCMVLTGGGSFQKHAKYIHERVGKKQSCVQIVQSCSRGLDRQA